MKLENRTYPCGCVMCICEDDEQCQGCGATSCKDFPDCKIKGMNLIGTCGECEHWEQMDSVGWGRCHHRQPDADISKSTIGYDFGCIHFEPKGKEIKLEESPILAFSEDLKTLYMCHLIDGEDYITSYSIPEEGSLWDRLAGAKFIETKKAEKK